MAEVKVSELNPKGANLDPTDLIMVSVFNGSTYDSYYCTGQEFIDSVTGGGLFTNETALADSTKDFDGYLMDWVGITEFYAEASNAPSMGNASFLWHGYGVLSTDISYAIETDAGTSQEYYGDLSQKAYGTCDIHSINKRIFDGNTNIYMRKSPAANGIEVSAAGGGGGVKGVWTFGYNDGELLASGNLGGDSLQMYSSSTNNYTVHADSAGNVAWRSGKSGNDYKVRGNLTGSYTATDIFTISQSTGEIEYLVAKLKGVLQTGNAGLSTGQWYQDTAANVLSNGDKVIAIKQ